MQAGMLKQGEREKRYVKKKKGGRIGGRGSQDKRT